MSWFARLTAAATSVGSAADAAVSEVSAAAERMIPSLDAMQESFGDPTGRKALFEGLDLSYLTPRIIGACRSAVGWSRAAAFAGRLRVQKWRHA